MKKLLVVFTAILVVAFAVPAFAADDAWSGEFTFGGITGFSETKVTNAFGNLYTDVFFEVDSYNKVLFEFVGTVTTDGTGGTFTVGAANLESDIGEAAGLPVGLKVRGGLSSIW